MPPSATDSPKATLQQASVTVPGPEKALVVQAALSSNTRGWTRGSGAVPDAEQGIRPELVDAYTLAVALAPTECHLSLSLLAAIGQVESGNLAGQRIDAQHRVVPGVLGPVLDGSDYAAIPDTDNGRWDGHRTWDRALGPLQLLPASWRVAGMDADGDGRRDPQNVYDAAGAAMVYLCDGGRDLGTRKGLEEAVLAYNHSRDYLRLVLAWKTVFDTADVTGLGSTPTLGAWAAQSILAPQPSKAADGSTSDALAATPVGSPEKQMAAAGARPPKLTRTATTRPTGSAAAATDPAAGPTVVPTASDPPAPPAPSRSPTSPVTSLPSPATSPPSLGTSRATPRCRPARRTSRHRPTTPAAAPTCCPAEPVEATATPTPTPSADPSTGSLGARPVRHRDAYPTAAATP